MKNMDLFSLDGKVAIITGGAGRLGKTFADTFAQAGASVVTLELPAVEEQCKALVSELSKSYPKTKPSYYLADLTSKEQISAVITKVMEKYGKIDILLNNATDFKAAGNFFETFEDYKLEDWKKVVETNVNGLFIITQRVAKEMIEKKKGVIINIGSTYGVVSPDQRIYVSKKLNSPLVYATTKSAVYNFTRYLATYLAPYNIRVNTITPGGLFSNQEEGFIKNYCSRVPMGRMANHDDYRGPMLFLASDASSYMTGADLVVDGGWTCW